ncbi:hypothetical protein BCR33DRAFT_248393 [Rhizoclosmatium globosum]|uniref:C2 domain-containing protein n=1 Tax=Rhizoclosmatium globosum TaxID=329046 RepID=A0A1Y2CA21_9FUNG|nr:hypothetical protein BCR33DRAFT_248393 [Rhizoclosmatium globosum]|eukprot:ORY43786.1 hypothetical protein BCR33DRAFT_248393 [Rhizoclosmatium globosum]
MATVLSISIRSLGGQRDTETDVIEAARSKDVTRSRNTSATTANAKGKQPQLELEHQSQQTRLLPLRSAATSSESLGHSLGSTVKRPPSASLLLLEALHGATVAAGADLKDSHFVIEKNGVPVYTSTVAPATLNPTWNIDATAFPTLTQNRRDLVLHIWTRSASRSTINNHFCQYRSINFNASLLNFIGRDLLELEKTHLSSELILVQLEDGIYRLDDDSSKPATDEQTSLDEDEIKDSYTRNAFVTLENLSSELTLLQEALGNLLKESEQKIPIKAVIADPNIAFRDCLFRKTSCLTQQIKSKSKVVEMERDKLDSLRKDIQRRKNRLFYSSKDREQCQQTLLSTINDLNDYGIIIHETFKYKTVSGRSFIAGIKEIYPINTLREDPNAYFIRRIWLPHSEFSSVDEDRTSTALGWTAHLVTLLALYLELPLRYPINPMSSRSMILDRISQHPAASMEFPLFMKGSDKQRFEYGVFLLNKNIEQVWALLNVNQQKLTK